MQTTAVAEATTTTIENSSRPEIDTTIDNNSEIQTVASTITHAPKWNSGSTPDNHENNNKDDLKKDRHGTPPPLPLPCADHHQQQQHQF